MKVPRIRISRRGRIILALALVLVWISARQRISQMDERFFQPSVSGIMGLALYSVGDYSGAAQAYRAHLQKLYQGERTAADPGWDALLRKDLPAAEEISRKALEEDPAAIAPLLTLGEIALEQDAPDQALGIFERILQKQPHQFDALLLSSVAHARSGAYGRAIDSLTRALRYNWDGSRITAFLKALKTTGDLTQLPRGERPLCLLANYYRYLGLFDPSNGRIAATYARKAIAESDRPDDAYLTLGVILHWEEKDEKALAAFLKALELNPKHAEGYRWAANIYADRADLLNEYRMKMAAFEAAPGDPFYIDGLSFFLTEKLGDYYQALALTQKFLETKPDAVRALHRVAYLYGAIGDDDRSVREYRKALLLDPRDPSLYEGIADSLGALGRRREAMEAYRTALLLDPGRPRAHIGLGNIYFQERRLRDAIREYEEAFRSGERDLSQLTNLCTLYHQVSAFERAATCFRQVLAEDPRNPMARHLLPYTLENLSRGSAKG